MHALSHSHSSLQHLPAAVTTSVEDGERLLRRVIVLRQCPRLLRVETGSIALALKELRDLVWETNKNELKKKKR